MDPQEGQSGLEQDVIEERDRLLVEVEALKEKATTLEHRNSFLEGQVERLRKKKERKAEEEPFQTVALLPSSTIDSLPSPSPALSSVHAVATKHQQLKTSVAVSQPSRPGLLSLPTELLTEILTYPHYLFQEFNLRRARRIAYTERLSVEWNPVSLQRVCRLFRVVAAPLFYFQISLENGNGRVVELLEQSFLANEKFRPAIRRIVLRQTSMNEQVVERFRTSVVQLCNTMAIRIPNLRNFYSTNLYNPPIGPPLLEIVDATGSWNLLDSEFGMSSLTLIVSPTSQIDIDRLRSRAQLLNCLDVPSNDDWEDFHARLDTLALRFPTS
ncbi:hypothetical protein BDY24DRAFT_104877 [Mrakia frigida]|uniref:uncharacterized protein n=1 Tax=Mrakia frigida TaxID=29902 RepID=UPI003FCC0245